LVAFNIDGEGLGDKRMVDVCVRRRGIDDDVGFDLLQYEADLLDVGDVSDVVCNSWKVPGGGTPGHNRYGGAGWLIEQELDHMVSQKATATYDQDSTEVGTHGVVWIESGLT
jgi:hypothetical protein